MKLRKHDCLYPGKTNSHHSVAALVRPFERLRGYTRSKYKNNPEKVVRRAEILREQIKNSDAETVLLSSEFLCKLDSEEIARLIEILGFSRQDVFAICYVRQPSRFFLSGIQQRLKTSVVFGNPVANNYGFHGMLQSWGSVIGKDNMIVRAFEKEQLSRGDVLLDLLCVLGERFSIDLTHHRIPRMNANSSLPAESCILMQELRKELLDLDDNVYADESRMLVKIIKSKSKWMRLSKMKFKGEVVSPIDSFHKSDLEWLKENYGIEFSACNTAATEEEMAHAQEIFSGGRLCDLLCDYDEIKLEKLRRRVVSSFKWKAQQAAIFRRFLRW